MDGTINPKDVEKFRELSRILAGLYEIQPREISLNVDISGTREVINSYKLRVLTGKDWKELYRSDRILVILDTMNELIEFER